MIYNIKEVVNFFQIYGDFISAEPYGSGHINDTFLVNINQSGKCVQYIAQRINHLIFKNPEGLMENIQRVTEHQATKFSGDDASRQHLTLILTKDGDAFYKTNEGNYWRIYLFIDKSKTYDIIESPSQAFQAAKAFGDFQKSLVDLSGGRLVDTIPDFHNTPMRFKALEDAIEADSHNRAKLAKAEINFAMDYKSISPILLDLNSKGLIPERVTHNDTKLNNVMIDDKTGDGICVIDLDTTMPGLVLYDFGDMIRTSTSPALEDEIDLSKVQMQMPMFEALAKGYISSAGEFLTKTEKEYLPFSGKLITYEIGLRFLTDYLSGDGYFKIHREGHNLDRCRTQFKLVSSINEQEDTMNEFISKL